MPSLQIPEAQVPSIVPQLPVAATQEPPTQHPPAPHVLFGQQGCVDAPQAVVDIPLSQIFPEPVD